MDPQATQSENDDPVAAGEEAPDAGPEREALERLGHHAEPEIVTELLAPARRGRDLAVLAGEGSGKEALYALTAATRCDPASAELQGLVLSPTRESAARVSRHLYELAGPEGLHALAWSSELASGEGGPPVAHVVAGRPEDLLRQIRAGRLGIENVGLLILDDVRGLLETDPEGATAAILDTIGTEAQVMAVSDRLDPAFTEIVERQLDRPRKWPRELFSDEEGPPAGGPPGLAWGAASSFEDRMDVLARGLRTSVPEEPTDVLVHCSHPERARRIAAALSARGFHIASEPGEPGVGVAWGEDEAPEGGVAAWFGLTSGLPGLRRTAGPAARRLAVVTPREVPHLTLLARRAGWSLEPIPGVVPESARSVIARYREEISRRMERADRATELLLLEPLIEAHGFPDVAAALSGWVRELTGDRPASTSPDDETAGSGPERRAKASTTGRPSRGRKRTGGRAPEAPWTRLFIPVGERDGVGPSDLVGAITGETDAVGGQIGKIEIKESHSLVEVESGVADHVIRGLSGATIRGRRVEARRDRKA